MFVLRISASNDITIFLLSFFLFIPAIEQQIKELQARTNALKDTSNAESNGAAREAERIEFAKAGHFDQEIYEPKTPRSRFFGYDTSIAANEGDEVKVIPS